MPAGGVPGPDADTLTAAAVTAALLAWNIPLGATGWHARHYLPANLAATATLLGIARARGVGAAELGLGREELAAGGRTGGAVAGAVAGALVVALAVPVTRPRLRDARVAALTGAQVARHAALRIPLGTALWEEVAFRAVLPALWRRVLPPAPAAAVSHLAFGLWHVRPSLDAARLNGSRAPGVAVAASVLATAAVSVGLSWLFRRSGSLLAPVLVHAGANAAGTLVSAAAERLTDHGVAR